jgi:hypothetical protein
LLSAIAISRFLPNVIANFREIIAKIAHAFPHVRLHIAKQIGMVKSDILRNQRGDVYISRTEALILDDRSPFLLGTSPLQRLPKLHLVILRLLSSSWDLE